MERLHKGDYMRTWRDYEQDKREFDREKEREENADRRVTRFWVVVAILAVASIWVQTIGCSAPARSYSDISCEARAAADSAGVR